MQMAQRERGLAQFHPRELRKKMLVIEIRKMWFPSILIAIICNAVTKAHIRTAEKDMKEA
jgi:hypothetical protein